MQIKVKSLQGQEYIVQVQEDELVSKLKASISEKADGLPVERQKLVYKGRTMQDSVLISEYRLEEDCKVHLILQKEPQVHSTAPGSTINGNNPTTTTTTTSHLNSSLNNSQSESNTTATTTGATAATGSPCPMDTSSASSLDQEHHRSTPRSSHNESSTLSSPGDHNLSAHSGGQSKKERPPPSRFELILRERLAHHFPSNSVDKIMENLYQEIDADIHSSSLDDLERLAKQKLNITNE